MDWLVLAAISGAVGLMVALTQSDPFTILNAIPQ